jgi:transposase InsO family protein
MPSDDMVKLIDEIIKREGIKHISSRKGNTQTDGKLERLWLEYDRYRWGFKSIEAFLFVIYICINKRFVTFSPLKV